MWMWMGTWTGTWVTAWVGSHPKPHLVDGGGTPSLPPSLPPARPFRPTRARCYSHLWPRLTRPSCLSASASCQSASAPPFSPCLPACLPARSCPPSINALPCVGTRVCTLCRLLSGSGLDSTSLRVHARSSCWTGRSTSLLVWTPGDAISESSPSKRINFNCINTAETYLRSLISPSDSYSWNALTCCSSHQCKGRRLDQDIAASGSSGRPQ